MTSAQWQQQRRHCVYMAKVLVKIRHRERAADGEGEAGAPGGGEWREGRIEAERKRETRGRRLLERRPHLLDFTAFG